MYKKRLKAILGWLLFSARLHKRLLGQRCVIVAFHRVCEEATGSPINCTPEDFRRYCEFLARHFTVISLAELLDRLKTGRSISGTAVITFDDGYKDNAEVAAPILRSLRLPATFFVATNFVGSRTQTPWDVDHGVESKWMSWSDIKALKGQQFDVGAHTASHVDLGAVDAEVAAFEIQDSKERLESELNVEVSHFAYPFGGKNNIRPETLALVKSAGFSCCLSCHGGLAQRGSDPHALPREPVVSWHDSPYQFGFELLQDI